MPKRRKSPPPGSVFTIPLRDHGYGVGVIARTTGDGVCLGYFFGPRLDGPDEVELKGLHPSRALLVTMFGDLHLLEGSWTVVGDVEPWTADEWPVPVMGRVDIVDGSRAFLTTYDDRLDPIQEVEVTPEEAAQYPRDVSHGAGSLEIALTRLLSGA